MFPVKSLAIALYLMLFRLLLTDSVTRFLSGLWQGWSFFSNMNGWTFAALLLCVLAISIFATLYQPAAEVVKSFYTTIASAGALGLGILIAIQALTVVAAIPVIVPNSALSALYSWPLAFTLSMTGYSLGLAIIYSLIMGCKWEPNDTFRGLHTVMKYQPYKYTMLARFIAMPSALKNYGLAGCPISFKVYFVCGFVHGMYVNGLQLAVVRQLWTADSAASYAVLVLSAAVGMGTLALFSYLAQKAIREAQQETQQAALLEADSRKEEN